jgi:CheY-like chemotaxis protein
MVKTDYADILKMTEKLHEAMVDLNMLSKKKILIVDDEEITLTMTKEMLKNDFNVTTVSSAKDALELFLDGYTPNLILLDLYMPEMGGWDALIRIRNLSKLHQTKIVIYTGSDDPKDRAKAKNLGAVDFIHKPIYKEELLAIVTKLLD